MKKKFNLYVCRRYDDAKQCVQTPENCKKHFTVHDDHSGVHWPEVANTALWLIAMDHAVFFWNHVLDPATGLSPTDLFTLTGFPLEKLHELHVLGSPAYVLDMKLVDGKKLPWLTSCSDQCVYLGQAIKYAFSVYLILNIATGSITPQYHVGAGAG